MERTGIGIGSLHFWNVGFSTFSSVAESFFLASQHERKLSVRELQFAVNGGDHDGQGAIQGAG